MAKKLGKLIIVTAVIAGIIAVGILVYNKIKGDSDDFDDFDDFDDEDFDDDFSDLESESNRGYVSIPVDGSEEKASE